LSEGGNIPGGQPGNHLAAGEGLDEEDEWHDGENVVVRGERSEPVHGEIMDPDDEDREIDG
jgi:hypothetical protein